MVLDRKDSLMKSMVTVAKEDGADQVLLLVSHSDNSFAGETMTPGIYAVALSNGSAGIVAHELGHNFGCHHDRPTTPKIRGKL